MVARLATYRNLRNNEYIPRKQEIALQEQFAANAQDNETVAPAPVVTGEEATPEELEEEEGPEETEEAGNNDDDPEAASPKKHHSKSAQS